MTYTLGEAAKATGKDRATISRALKKGKISAVKNEQGQWQIEPAELHRVYPITQQDNTLRATDDARIRNSDLESDNRVLRAEIEAAKGRISDLEMERDKWQAAFEKQQDLAANALRQLEDHRQQGGQGFWSRLFGKH